MSDSVNYFYPQGIRMNVAGVVGIILPTHEKKSIFFDECSNLKTT
ncbi:hypothetical protein [Carnobacterium gallinarum]|nr:hypothetical protein [Carnobacterium gallinarum]